MIEKKLNYKLKTLLMSGGEGTRLIDVTGGNIAKGRIAINPEGTISGIEYISDILNQLNLHDVAICVNHFSEQYKTFAEERDYDLLYQGEKSGTGGALEEAIEEYGYDQQYLLIATDNFD